MPKATTNSGWHNNRLDAAASQNHGHTTPITIRCLTHRLYYYAHDNSPASVVTKRGAFVEHAEKDRKKKITPAKVARSGTAK